LRRIIICALVAWSAICAFALQIHFPHFLFICERVEAAYGGTADDSVVSNVMQAIVAVLWLIGILTITLVVPLVRNTIAQHRARSAK
jgi:hypothetical protein